MASLEVVGMSQVRNLNSGNDFLSSGFYPFFNFSNLANADSRLVWLRAFIFVLEGLLHVYSC